ncbi:carboxylesterase/lipase family protein [Nonomuraea aurantiaca]|uniref:carboxylesterase/lipase family protein n=1 Tax=Nonomuraea aurantiaca TaxID=2878562 RepID=UPI001CD94BD8|nr:carboxylesterase family protein [Nonomuraea aurantiaca]MCA2220911.1 carboxylesterase family protein [Nonomuraea aurantiaca]
MSPTTVEVSTAYGPVSGLIENGIASFRGIPYAAAPVGPNRFGAPVPPDTWSAPLPAHEFGPTPPQPPLKGKLGELFHNPVIPGDGYLNLNVWTSAAGSDAAMPVLVWIHGGAFTTGSSAVTTYDGATFARDGVVCVTINYRLGVDGFAYIEDAAVPANRGLLDQIFALEWVRDNIAGFGGDPGNVTVAGESAGAMSVLTLLSLDRELFHQAIVESGSAHIGQTLQDAALVTAAVATRLGVEPTAQALAAVDTAALMTAQAEVSDDVTSGADPVRYGASTIASCGMSFMPVIDGEVVPRLPIDAIADGRGADVPLLIGTTVEEFRTFVVPTAMVGWPGAAPFRTRTEVYGAPAGFYDRYADTSVEPYVRNAPSGIACATLTDRMFRIPTYRIAEARGDAPATTHVFEFGWRSPATPNTLRVKLGACHSLPLPFVWDTLDNPDSAEFTGPNPPQGLADAMHGRWVEFVKTGDLDQWAPYNTTERPVMTFYCDNQPDNVIVHDPRRDEREIWKNDLNPS